jgi:hypothetical protein
MGDAAADDVELALRARAGCVESFAALAARHQVAIVHYVVWMLGRGRRRPAASWAVVGRRRGRGRVCHPGHRWWFVAGRSAGADTVGPAASGIG